jgi:hypothetical protein
MNLMWPFRIRQVSALQIKNLFRISGSHIDLLALAVKPAHLLYHKEQIVLGGIQACQCLPFCSVAHHVLNVERIELNTRPQLDSEHQTATKARTLTASTQACPP